MTNKNKIISSAQRFISKGQWDKAIKELQRLVAEDPSDVRALLKLGDVHSKKGDRDAATKVYRQVAESYSDQGFFLKAVAVYKQILKHDPKHLEVTLKLAELYEHLGLSSEAMGQYHRAAQLKEEKGQTRETLDILKRMVDLDGENVASRIKLAESFSKENLLDQATKEFEKAAQLLKNQNRIDDYIKVAERLIFHDQGRLELIKELARLYLDRNDAKRALAKLQICFKAEPKDLETLQMLAQAFSALGQTQKTIFVYKELVRLHQERGKDQDASAIIQQILMLDPNDPDVKSMIGGTRPPPPAPSPQPRSASVPPPYPPVAAVQRGPEHPAVANEWHVPSQPGYPFGTQPPSIPMPTVEPRPRMPSLAPRPPPKDDIVLEDPVEAPPPPLSPPPRAPSLVPPPRASSGSRPRPSPEQAEIAKVLTETEVYIKYGLRDKALSHLRRVFELDPDNLEAHQKMRDIYRAMGDRARAAEAVANLMHVHQKRGDVAALEAARAELAQLLPGHPLASGGIPGAIPRPMAHDEASGEHISIDIDEDSGVFELTDEVREPPNDEPIGDEPLSPAAGMPFGDERAAFGRQDVIADDLLADGHLEFRPDAMTDPAPEEPPRLPPPRRAPISDLATPAALGDEEVPEVFSGVVLLADVETPEASTSNPSFADDDDDERDDDEPIDDEPVNEIDPFAGNESSEVTARQSLARAAARPERRDSVSSRREITERAHVDVESFTDETTGREQLDAPRAEKDDEATDAYAANDAPPEVGADIGDDELEEARFLIETGLEEEAKDELMLLLERFPGSAKIRELLASLSPAEEPGGEPGDAEDTASDSASDTGDALALPLDHLPLPDDDGTSPSDRYDQGMMYKEIGRIDDAIREFRAAAISEARRTESLEMIGHCLMEKGSAKDAVAYFARALSTGAQGISAINLEYEIANASEASGDRGGALRWFETCFDHDPDHRDVAARLEGLRGASGNGKADHANGTREPDPPPSPRPSKKSKISYL